MGDTANPKPKSGALWLRIVLFTSLAINLLIVGMVAGALLRGGGKGGGRDGPPLYDLGYGPFGRALSQDDRRVIGAAMAERAGDLRSNREQYRAQTLRLLEALRTTPYQPQLVREIITQQQRRLLERQDIGKLILLDHVEKMTDQERLAYAERLERSFRRGGRR